MKVRGRVWLFGNDINTDLILPGPVIYLAPSERPKHMFRANRPGWAAQVQTGDILVAGTNYGTGSGRPGAQVMKDLGLTCLLAETINGLFFRNCVNLALPALEVAGVTTAFEEGDIAEVDFEAARVRNERTGDVLIGERWHPKMLEILMAGGIVPVLERQGLLEPETRREATSGPPPSV